MPVTLRALTQSDLIHVLRWNEDTDADFLMQWAGGGYAYPLTYEQLYARFSAGSGDYMQYAVTLEDAVIGTVELCRLDREAGVAWVARCLLDGAYRGRGLGEAALRALVSIAFDNIGLRRLCLTVFEFNKAALRCYEKAGFTVFERVLYPNGWAALRMELTEGRWRTLPSAPSS